MELKSHLPSRAEYLAQQQQQQKRASLSFAGGLPLAALLKEPGRRTESELHALAKAIARIDPFVKHTLDEVADCCRAMPAALYNKNDKCFVTGDPSLTFYVVLTGSVLLVRRDDDSYAGNSTDVVSKPRISMR